MATEIRNDPNAVQCPWKTDKGRQCKLQVGHAKVEKTQHGHLTVIRSGEKHTLSDVVPAGFRLQKTKVAPGIKIVKQSNRSTGPRDQDQKNIDKDASELYAEWSKKRPENWDDWPKMQYTVPVKAVDTLLEYLRATVNNGGPCPGKTFRYRRGTSDSGGVLITWGIGDPKVKNAG